MRFVHTCRHMAVPLRFAWFATLAVIALLAVPSAGHAAGKTFVSLTFDDGGASQYALRSALASHGMHGTFFINTSEIGTPTRMTWSQVSDLQSDGNEIGGHTLTHPHLTTLTPAEQQHEICDDRTALLSHGIPAKSFAYPFGDFDASVQAVVQGCGYTSARNFGLLYDVCTDFCPYGESVPPADLFGIRTQDWHTTPLSLEMLKGWVMQVEDHGGGWMPLVFHGVCDSCGGESSVSAATFDAFLDWLEARQEDGTAVKTFGEMTAATSQVGDFSDAILGTPGLGSYWRLGESSGTVAVDQKGSHPGTYKGGPALSQAGALKDDGDTAAGFDGSNDELTAGGPSLGATGSIEGWFRWTSGVAVMRDNTSTGGWILGFDNAGKLAYRVGGKTFTTNRLTSSVKDGWHHFALTVSGGTTAFYVDGALVHSGSGAPVVATAMPWHVMHNGVYAQYTAGWADEVAVYSSALSGTTVFTHYLDGLGALPETTAPTAPAGLVATAGNGNVALDWADNGDPDLAGYNVYRATIDGGPYTKINSTPVGSSAYVDASAINGVPYFYVVKAVNSSGLESASSQQQSATPAAPAGATYADAVLGTPGLTSYWRLGESSGATAVDQNGINPGSYSGGVALVQPGAPTGDGDTAAAFDGSNDEMTAGGPSLGATGTLEGWFYWTGGVAVMRDHSTSAGGWILAYDRARNVAYRVGGKSFTTNRTVASLRDGWHHLALTVSGGSTAFYVDGVLVHTGAGAPANAAVMPWHVMRNGRFNQYAAGRADEVAVYSSALSAATVAAHYDAAQ